MTTYRGNCHCGAVGFEYQTKQPVDDWFVRACECSFCAKHGAIYTSDPAGSLRFCTRTHRRSRATASGTRRRTSFFCGRCGGYLGAIMEEGGQVLFVMNIRALDPQPEGLPAAKTMTYEEETARAA
jgi:hypothetical protein